MSIRTCLPARRVLALVPALVLGAGAVLSEDVYAAASSSGECFHPALEIFSSNSGPSTSKTGKADVNLHFKPPFIIEGVATAQGSLSQDSGAVGALGASGTSRLWTPTCPTWAYGWCAKGFVVGQVKSIASKTGNGSAVGVASFAATAAGDLNPQAHDAKTAQSATTGGLSISVAMGASPSGPSYSLGVSTAPATVSPSTNPAGDANTLYDGPKTNVGAGGETLVVVNLYAYVNAQANGGAGGAGPDVCKSSCATGGYAGVALEQELYAVDPGGRGVGMGVHPQSGFYRLISKCDINSPWTRGPLKPPVGNEFIQEGPEEKTVTDPPTRSEPIGGGNGGGGHEEGSGGGAPAPK